MSLFKALEDAAQQRGEAPKPTASEAANPFGRRSGLTKGRVGGSSSPSSLGNVPLAGQLTDVIEDRPTLSDLLQSAQGEAAPQATYDAATDTIDLRDSQPATPDETVAVTPVVSEPCERCGALAKRDLFDRFSRKAYFSCSACGLMWQQTMTS